MKEFIDFLDLFIDYICARCGIGAWGKWRPGQHHNGEINNFLTSSKQIDESFFTNFFNDTEHGFFHGLCACFIAYTIKKEKKNMEQLFSSLLMHDFLKCNNYSQKMHDVKLINYYNNLEPITYSHSNPKKDEESQLLIISDRIELRRYNDYKEWIDDRYYDIFKNLDKNTNKTIDSFYNKLRPGILHFYENRNEIFIRHGLENTKLEKYNGNFPPDYSYLSLKDAPYAIKNVKKEIIKNTESNCYPIEIDRCPFGFLPIGPDKKYHIQRGYCSNHECDHDINCIKGFITLKDFIKLNGKIVDSKKRDHLYAASEIDINNWIFLYQNINNNEKLLRLNNLIDNDIRVIEQKLISKFFELIKLLQDRIIVLNYTTK